MKSKNEASDMLFLAAALRHRFLNKYRAVLPILPQSF